MKTIGRLSLHLLALGLVALFCPRVPAQGWGELWTDQFGTSGDDSIRGLVAKGVDLYAVGSVGGALLGQTSAGGSDAYIRRYASSGKEIWTRQFGSASRDVASAVGLNASGVYVAGVTEGVLPGQAGYAGEDGFVRKYGFNGTELWTRQFASTSIGGAQAKDLVFGLAVDGSGVYLAGRTNGVLPGQTNSGGNDAFIRKYDNSGAELWTHQFGSPSQDYASSVAVDGSGVYIAGFLKGTFFLRKYGLDGIELWSRQFGTGGQATSGSDEVWVATGVSGIYVAGTTSETLPGQTSAGQQDAFVRKYDLDGTELWTRQFGTAVEDRVRAVGADGSGVYVAGITFGVLLGQTNSGGAVDAYVRKYDPVGNQVWTRQFGTSDWADALALAVSSSGVYVGGYVRGALPGHASAGQEDAFVREYDRNLQ